MIELDLFGNFGRRFIRNVEDYILSFERGFYRGGTLLRIEELDKIPENYEDKDFVVRISFSDEYAGSVKQMLMDTDERCLGQEDYEIISGYFPVHFEPKPIIEDKALDWDGLSEEESLEIGKSLGVD